MQHESIVRSGLSAAAALKAQEELGETDERKSECLEKLRVLIASGCLDDNLPKTYEEASDSYLLRFLRAKKYDVENSYRQIKEYERFLKKYKIREKADNKSTIKRLAQCQPGVLTTRDAQGQVALLYKIKDWDPSEYSFSDCVATYVYILDRLLESEDTQVNGITIIQNFEGYTLRQMAGASLFEYKQMIDMLQGSVPLRFKGVFCLNQPSFFVKIYNLIKVFLGEKLRSRIHIYGKDIEDLFECFPRESIPRDFGGEAPEYDGHAVAELLLNNNL